MRTSHWPLAQLNIFDPRLSLLTSSKGSKQQGKMP